MEAGIQKTDVLILCGGLGTRLRSHLGNQPKIMASINGRPFLDILLNFLQDQGCQRVILCTGYQAGVIEEYCRNKLSKDLDLKIEYSQESEPLGTGGALKFARGSVKSQTFFVFNGDSFCPVSLSDVLRYHHKKKAKGTIGLNAVKANQDFGLITLDQNHKIISFLEKQRLNKVPADHKAVRYYINVGIYCLDRGVFSLMGGEEKFSLERDLFPQLIDQGLYGYEIPEKFIDIGTPLRFKQAQEYFNP